MAEESTHKIHLNITKDEFVKHYKEVLAPEDVIIYSTKIIKINKLKDLLNFETSDFLNSPSFVECAQGRHKINPDVFYDTYISFDASLPKTISEPQKKERTPSQLAAVAKRQRPADEPIKRKPFVPGDFLASYTDEVIARGHKVVGIDKQSLIQRYTVSSKKLSKVYPDVFVKRYARYIINPDWLKSRSREAANDELFKLLKPFECNNPRKEITVNGRKYEAKVKPLHPSKLTLLSRQMIEELNKTKNLSTMTTKEKKELIRGYISKHKIDFNRLAEEEARETGKKVEYLSAYQIDQFLYRVAGKLDS